MAELTFKSPGVSTREIDLSGPANIVPQGTPAGVIGTAQKGRAFVPITVATYQDFVAEFGGTDGEKFGPLAMYEWFQNARAGTYVRILGVGDGTKRVDDGLANSGRVNYSGFVAGSRQVQATGDLGNNSFAGGNQTGYNGELGRTYFLGCLMSESNGSRYLSDAGIAADKSMPIVRGVVMAASGVIISLSSSFSSDNSPNNTLKSSGSFTSNTVDGDAGSHLGTVNISDSKADFVMMLNGLVPSDRYLNVITASFDPNSAQYFSRVLNTDPLKMEQAGHYLYTSWDVYPAYAVVTSSGQQTGNIAGTNLIEAAFLLTGSQMHNSGTTTLPNYEGFESRYSTAFSPFVVSQKFGGKPKNLFRIHALDDGASANDLFKVTIENISATKNENSPYGTFDLLVRNFYDTDENPVVFESFRSLSLDPGSERYIARIIGDQHVYYDFDQKRGSQKLRVEGSYPNVSKYVRIEMDPSVDSMTVDSTALPVGFRGPNFLLTSGTNSSGAAALEGYVTGSHGVTVAKLQAAQVAPVPYRLNMAKGLGLSKKVNSALTWGVQFEVQSSLTDPNGTVGPDRSRPSYTRYFPMYHTNFRNVMLGNSAGAVADGGMVLDSDAFQNNLFSLENIQVATSSVDKPDDKHWDIASYRRNGVKLTALTASDGTTYTDANTRFLDPNKDFSHLPSRKYLKFSFFVQGGFDGVNLFDSQKSDLTDVAIRREFGSIQGQGGIEGPTLNSYRKAIDVMGERADVDIQILAIPGVRHYSVTDYAIEAVENRFDALLLMDIEEKDQVDQFITGSTDLQRPSVEYTVNRFADRNMNTSFAAAYYPDVIIQDPATRTNVVVPPTVAVLGAFALNDTVAHPWFAPAGFSRGALPRVLETQVKLNRANLDDLYEVDVNPLTSFADASGVVVFGQKTLLAAQSALDRVNVRRLLIEVRRRVRRISNTFLFEPNREETLGRFSAAVGPVLQQIQAQRGVDRYRVQIDTTTTTQADVENNTIRGKIYLQPTRSLEFVSLDFVVTNQGATI